MSFLMTGYAGRVLGGQPAKGVRVLLRPLNLNPRVLCVSISSKANMKLKGYTRPPPYDYKRKYFNLLHSFFDGTMKRFNENSKIVVVDGTIASGKSTFAKALAEELDMQYFPSVDLVKAYTNGYGQSMRDFNHLLPTRVQAFDLTDFRRNPNHPNVPSFHINMLLNHFINYLEALAHVFNTGQGVVMERCLYSDYLFMETNYENGYISSQVRRYYREMNMYMRDILLRPHLIIYLDVPVDVAIQRVKQRGHEWEVNSPTIGRDYLARVEDRYKNDYLKAMGNHCDLMVYDWSDYGIMEMVVEDIEALPNVYKQWEGKHQDWVYLKQEKHYATSRKAFTRAMRQPGLTIREFTPSVLEAPELIVPQDDLRNLDLLLRDAPGWKYAYGFNREMGDKNIFFKVRAG